MKTTQLLMATNFGAAAEDYAEVQGRFSRNRSSSGWPLSGCAKPDRPSSTWAPARDRSPADSRVGERRSSALDPDERLVQQACQLDAAASVSIQYRKGTAEAIPLPDAVADVVAAGQCWHWFDAPKAAREFVRIARPGGRVVVATFDWLPLPGNVVKATEKLIEAHNPQWRMGGGNGFHPGSVPHLHAVGFREFETFSYDLDVPLCAGGMARPHSGECRHRREPGPGASPGIRRGAGSRAVRVVPG